MFRSIETYICYPMKSTHKTKMATLSGLEPELSGPKPLVLPLHHRVAKTTAFYFSTVF